MNKTMTNLTMSLFIFQGREFQRHFRLRFAEVGFSHRRLSFSPGGKGERSAGNVRCNAGERHRGPGEYEIPVFVGKMVESNRAALCTNP